MANFNLNNYVPVNDRIAKFYKAHPEGRITTKLTSDDKTVTVKAYIYRDRTQPVEMPDATGHAEETRDSNYINKTSAVENCETSAVGRGLAMLGLEISKSVASREEVQRAKEQQEIQAKTAEVPTVDPKLVEKARELMVGRQLTGAKATEFLDFIIGKPSPQTEEDYQMLITALTDAN